MSDSKNNGHIMAAPQQRVVGKGPDSRYTPAGTDPQKTAAWRNSPSGQYTKRRAGGAGLFDDF